jgi:hypothetical protein
MQWAIQGGRNMAIMKDTVRNDDGQGIEVYIEYDENDAIYGAYEGDIDVEDELRGPGIPDAKKALQKAMGLIHTCAEQVAHTVQNIPTSARPAACEVQFAIKLSTGVAILANATSEAQLQITLKWGKSE